MNGSLERSISLNSDRTARIDLGEQWRSDEMSFDDGGSSGSPTFGRVESEDRVICEQWLAARDETSGRLSGEKAKRGSGKRISRGH